MRVYLIWSVLSTSAGTASISTILKARSRRALMSGEVGGVCQFGLSTGCNS